MIFLPNTSIKDVNTAAAMDKNNHTAYTSSSKNIPALITKTIAHYYIAKHSRTKRNCRILPPSREPLAAENGAKIKICLNFKYDAIMICMLVKSTNDILSEEAFPWLILFANPA